MHPTQSQQLEQLEGIEQLPSLAFGS